MMEAFEVTAPPANARLLARVFPSAAHEISAWWFGSRVLVFGTCLAAQASGLSRPGWRPGLLAHPFALLGLWDGRWYRIVALNGYLLIPGRFSDPAFFPLLPVLERLAGRVGLSPVVAAVVVANAGFLAGLLAVYALSREFLPEPTARRTAIYLAVFPLSFVFSMAYPEGVVLPLVALTGLLAVRNRWLSAAFCAALATLGRPEAIVLTIPIAALALRRWHALPSAARPRAAAAMLAPAAALASFCAYLWRVTGDPLAWAHAERAWGRTFSLNGPREAITALATALPHHNPWLFRDAAFCLIDLALLVVAARSSVPRAWAAAGVAIILMPLATGSFTSDARFGLLALPVFWGLAELGRRRWVHRTLLVCSPLLLAAGVFSIPMHFP